MKKPSVHEALRDLIFAIQEAGHDVELEAGCDGEGPVAMGLLALGEKNIYDVNDNPGYEEIEE